MNLLSEGIQNKTVLKTEQVVKMTVDGVVDSYPVYKVRLRIILNRGISILSKELNWVQS